MYKLYDKLEKQNLTLSRQTVPILQAPVVTRRLKGIDIILL